MLSFERKMDLLRLLIKELNIKPCASIGNVIPLYQLIALYGTELNNNKEEFVDVLKELIPLAPQDQQSNFVETFYTL